LLLLILPHPELLGKKSKKDYPGKLLTKRQTWELSLLNSYIIIERLCEKASEAEQY